MIATFLEINNLLCLHLSIEQVHMKKKNLPKKVLGVYRVIWIKAVFPYPL